MTDPISKQPVDHEFKIQSLDLLDQSMIKVRNCFRQLSEDQIWWTPCATANSIGNLVYTAAEIFASGELTGSFKSPTIVNATGNSLLPTTTKKPNYWSFAT